MIKAIARRIYRRLYAYLNYESIWLNQRESFKNWSIGDHSYGHPDGSPHLVYYGEPVRLEIGKFCSFAEDIWIMLGGNHRTDWITTYPLGLLFDEAARVPGHPISRGDILIGNDVWVGLGATILSDVHIGDGAVIAAFSVVTKNVPAYSIVAGNPARVVKMRFDPQTIENLIQTKWWDWPLPIIREHLSGLLSRDVDKIADVRCDEI